MRWKNEQDISPIFLKKFEKITSQFVDIEPKILGLQLIVKKILFYDQKFGNSYTVLSNTS